jgi:hypothetical protein
VIALILLIVLLSLIRSKLPTILTPYELAFYHFVEILLIIGVVAFVAFALIDFFSDDSGIRRI